MRVQIRAVMAAPTKLPAPSVAMSTPTRLAGANNARTRRRLVDDGELARGDLVSEQRSGRQATRTR
jgi:hypothetical protein